VGLLHAPVAGGGLHRGRDVRRLAEAWMVMRGRGRSPALRVVSVRHLGPPYCATVWLILFWLSCR
jgi:hypothetical protein